MASTTGTDSTKLSGLTEFIQQYKTLLKPYADTALVYANNCRTAVNTYCDDWEPWQIILCTLGLTVAVIWIYQFLFDHDLSPWQRLSKFFFKTIRKIPIIGPKIQQEIEKTMREIESKLFPLGPGQRYVNQLPDKGIKENELMKLIEDKYHAIESHNWEKGMVSGTVYCGSQDLTRLTAKVYGEFAWANPLHPDVFPGLRKMEAEVVAMCVRMFNGGPKACGAVTTGGTESILMACRAYRAIAYERGVKRPEILAPKSVHAAFDKAATYFCMKVVRVPQDENMRCDIKAMERMINKNTCVLVGSAPQFPHGSIDPIEDISKLALKYNLPCHVDACLGGFLIAFMDKAGYPLQPFDFRLEGVTSISADTHKYGYAPKGSSVVLYKNEEIRSGQYFAYPDWQGGLYATPCIGGNHCGAIIAATCAVMMYHGEQGYVEATRKVIETTRYIEAGIREIEGLHIVGSSDVSVVAFGSLDFDIFQLSDMMTKQGWHLNPLQFPTSIHICCTLVHTKTGYADKFLNDLRLVTAEMMSKPRTKPDGSAAMYGMAQTIPDRSIVTQVACTYYNAYYRTTPSPLLNGME
ncbi:sphingosine-1-phosphate lyase 1-like [Saccoglossus kowalevskii]